jgi:hypothetical protein
VLVYIYGAPVLAQLAHIRRIVIYGARKIYTYTIRIGCLVAHADICPSMRMTSWSKDQDMYTTQYWVVDLGDAYLLLGWL